MSRATVKVTQDDSVREILELLKGRRSMQSIAKTLLRGVHEGNQMLMGLIQKERLTGKGPFPVPQKRLGIVTGQLRRRLRFSRPSFQAGVLKTEVGSGVRYWARHEYGGGGRTMRIPKAKVKAHTRTNFMGRGKRVKIPAHTRQAYTRKDNMPKREPVQAGLRQHATRVYGTMIEKHLVRLLEGGQV
jgi:hypothetical protein